MNLTPTNSYFESDDGMSSGGFCFRATENAKLLARNGWHTQVVCMC
jgi:hypothetical protein